MAGPGVEPGARQDMNLLDVAPTVLELLGLDVPSGMRGRSLLGASRFAYGTLTETGLLVAAAKPVLSPKRWSCTRS